MSRKHMTAFIIVIVSIFVIARSLMTSHRTENQTVKEKAVSADTAGSVKKLESENEKKSPIAGEKLTKAQSNKRISQAAPKATSQAVIKSNAINKQTVNKKDNQGTTNKQTNKVTSNGNNSHKAAVGQNTASKQKACHVVNHPAVTHQEPVYETRQVQTGTKTVIDKPAWDERVCVGDRFICNDCGAVCASDDELEAHGIAVHHYAFVGYHNDPIFQTVHHDAVTHQEPVYGTQQYQTGTRTVTDKAAWAETVCD